MTHHFKSKIYLSLAVHVKLLQAFLVAFTPTSELAHNQEQYKCTKFMPNEMQMHAGLGQLFPLDWIGSRKKEKIKEKGRERERLNYKEWAIIFEMRDPTYNYSLSLHKKICLQERQSPEWRILTALARTSHLSLLLLVLLLSKTHNRFDSFSMLCWQYCRRLHGQHLCKNAVWET